MHPLNKSAALTQIKAMFSRCERIVVAAPYFGRGASAALGLNKTSAKIEIVCDLFSGGCNPQEIREIAMLKPKPIVKRLAGLHAKIYLTEREVVIGSANPSSNGLGFEGSELAGNIEGCVYSNDPAVVSAWQAFYEQEVLSHAADLTANDISLAEPLFKNRRENRRRSDQRSVVFEMLHNRDGLQDKKFYIALHGYGDFSNEEESLRNETQEQFGSEDIDCWGASFFGDADPGAGATIIDFGVAGQKVKFEGIWQMLAPRHRFTNKAADLMFAVRVDQVGDMSLPAADVQYLQRLIKSRLKLENSFVVSLYEAATIVQQHAPELK